MTLQLNLQAPAKPFVSGGPVPVGLNLRNTGDAVVDVPASLGPTQFEFLLLTEDGGRTIESLSYRTKELSRGGGLRPRLKPEMQSLAPGKFMLYRADLSALTLHPIAPGKYQLEALYRMPGNVLVRSNRVPIEVIASRPAATVQGLDSTGANLHAYEFHREGDGPLTLRHWASPTNNPVQGRFQPLPAAAPPDAPGSLAMAMEVEHGDLGVWRWLAWTSGNQVEAEVTRAIDAKYPSGMLATGLADSELFEFGYQFADGHGLFLLTGRGEAGRSIRLLTLPADDEVPPKFLDVPLPPVPEAAARATFYSRPADPEDAASKAAHELALSWILRSDDRYGFVMARLDPGTGALVAPPHLVFSTDRGVIAYEIPAVAWKEIPASFAFLLAPVEEGSAYTRLTVNVHDTTQREEWDLPPFGGPGTVERWIFPSAHKANAPVLAMAKSRLWRVRRGSAWQDTRLDVTSAASPVRLWSLPSGEFWCTWFDREQGYQVRRAA